MAVKFVRVENRRMPNCLHDLFAYQQIILEKQTLEFFRSLHADELIRASGDEAEFVVFGVVTEYCVGLAVKGLLERKRRVAVVRDAIETLSPRLEKSAWPSFRSWEHAYVTTDEDWRWWQDRHLHSCFPRVAAL